MKADSVLREPRLVSFKLCSQTDAFSTIPPHFADKTPLPDCVCAYVSERTSPRSPTNTSAVLLWQLRFCFPVTLPFTPHI